MTAEMLANPRYAQLLSDGRIKIKRIYKTFDLNSEFHDMYCNKVSHVIGLAGSINDLIRLGARYHITVLDDRISRHNLAAKV